MSPTSSLTLPLTGRERVRRIEARVAVALAYAACAIVILPLFSIFLYVTLRGASSLSLSFFTNLPKPVGELGGGMGNALLGTVILVGQACLMGLPIGLLAGVYLAEVGRGTFASAVRFTADVLGGVPSISVGVFVYAIVVVAMHRFSAFAGSVALAVLLVPSVTRTTEEFLRLVPRELREAALGLGIPAWRATLLVVVRTAAPGILTGAMLAVARIAGETAPLLFTAMNSRFWSVSLDRPIASLPVQILTLATSPYDDWQRQAWAGALVLVAFVVALNIGARALGRRLGRVGRVGRVGAAA